MELPESLKYTKDHEWLKIDGDSAVVGITEFAQSELGELVFVELPAVGKKVSLGDSLCVVESTKAASDVYAPVTGEVAEVNTELTAQPTLVNEQPYSKGWMVKLKGLQQSDLAGLMSAAEYGAHLAGK